MYRNLYYTLGLIVALMGVLTSCADERWDMPLEAIDTFYEFDENGIPQKTSEDLLEKVFQGDLVIGYEWIPVSTRIIKQNGSSYILSDFDREEMNIAYQSYYIEEDKLTTTYRFENDRSSEGTTYTEQAIFLDGDIYEDSSAEYSTNAFRLRILEVIVTDENILMIAIEPLCIEYYGDDDEGRIIYGETLFHRVERQ